MTQQEDQAELDRCRDIAFAAIEYDIEIKKNLLPSDQGEYYKNFHRIWREQIEKQYEEKELKKLQKLLMNLTMVHKIKADLDFVKYIKEKTGYDYDLMGNIHERIAKIIARNRIANNKELVDVATMVELYRRTGTGQENAALLLNLQIDFNKTKSEERSAEEGWPVKYLAEINSPDNNKYLVIYESHDKDYPSTYLNINFKEGRGVSSSVYAAEGINLAGKAYWKGNNTIVIETKKDYKVFMRHEKKEYLGDTVMVEYVFIE